FRAMNLHNARFRTAGYRRGVPLLSRNLPLMLAVFTLTAAFSACTPPSTNVAVTVTPATATLAVGPSLALSASSTDGADTFSWASNNIAVATVDASGIVTAEGIGSARITATGSSSAAEGFADLTVTAGDGGVPDPPVITSTVTGTNQETIEITGNGPP